MKADGNLIDYIQSNNDEVIGKGMGLYADWMEDIVTVEKKRNKYFIQVPSETGKGSYIATLNMLSNNVEDNCECKAYKRFGGCKHCVAAALHLLVKEHGYAIEDIEELIEEDDCEGYEKDEELFDFRINNEDVFEKKKPAKIIPMLPAAQATSNNE